MLGHFRFEASPSGSDLLADRGIGADDILGFCLEGYSGWSLLRDIFPVVNTIYGRLHMDSLSSIDPGEAKETCKSNDRRPPNIIGIHAQWWQVPHHWPLQIETQDHADEIRTWRHRLSMGTISRYCQKRRLD